MTSADLTDPIFHDEIAVESTWKPSGGPNGPVCPHCGVVEDLKRLEGKSHRASSSAIRAVAFTVMTGSVVESATSRFPSGF